MYFPNNEPKIKRILPMYWHFIFLKNTGVCRIFSGLFTNDSVQKRRMYIFCILRLKAWQPKWYYFWRRLLIPIHSTLRVWYDISNFPSILLPLLYFIKGQEISKFNGPILMLFKKRMKFFLNFDLSCLDQNLEIILYFCWKIWRLDKWLMKFPDLYRWHSVFWEKWECTLL